MKHDPTDCPVGDPTAPACIDPQAHRHPATCPDCVVVPMFARRFEAGHIARQQLDRTLGDRVAADRLAH